MLYIPNHTSFGAANSYAALARQYLPEASQQQSISDETQQAVLEQLDAQIKNERFYIITDVKTGAIILCNGISNWLGYTDAHFSQKTYLGIIHPAHAVIQGFYAIALFGLFINRQINVHFMEPNCSAALALKNKNGKYLYCKRQCRPFQLTDDGKMTGYLSELTVIKEFANEEFYTAIQYEAKLFPGIKIELEKALKKKFEENSGFSVQELRILKRYAYTENVSSETIAKAFRIEKATVETFNKRILRKTENVFSNHFDNAKRAAEYFKRLHLI